MKTRHFGTDDVLCSFVVVFCCCFCSLSIPYNIATNMVEIDTTTKCGIHSFTGGPSVFSTVHTASMGDAYSSGEVIILVLIMSIGFVTKDPIPPAIAPMTIFSTGEPFSSAPGPRRFAA